MASGCTGAGKTPTGSKCGTSAIALARSVQAALGSGACGMTRCPPRTSQDQRQFVFHAF